MRAKEENNFIEKMVSVMRNYRLLHTKEEGNEPCGYPLIDALTFDGGTVDIGEEECGELAAELYDSVIASFILEAEHRAEQRVRSEIGRDSERLDWLERQFKSCTVYMNGECSFSPSPVIRNLKGHSFRQAIDAAREVG
ncbi:MAG: hypothetical protein ABF751_09780 [Acetobacter orientalis]|uniref:hypothetical protein n=1 Tax=Acetobacter TaxID=434 RepID=UPI0039EC7932